MRIRTRTVMVLALLTGSTLLARLASAGVVFGFDQFTTNASPLTATQYKVDISDGGTVGADHWADFKFTNTCVVASSLTDIYFEDGTLLDITDIDNNGTWNAPGTGVYFVQPGSPASLPGGNNIGFAETASFNQSAGASGTSDGVNASTEYVTLHIKLKPGKTYSDTIDAMRDRTLRIGLHVQSIGGGTSNSFIDGGELPLPAGGLMAMAGIGCLATVRRRRHG